MSITTTHTYATVIAVIDQYNSTSYSTELNTKGNFTLPTSTDADGTVTTIVTDYDHALSRNVYQTLTYPNIGTDYPSNIVWSGTLPTHTKGSNTCQIATMTTTQDFPSHPFLPTSTGTVDPEDPRGWQYVALPNDWQMPGLLRSLFPSFAPLHSCLQPLSLVGPAQAVVGAAFTTVSSTIRITGPPTAAPSPSKAISKAAHTSQSLPSGDASHEDTSPAATKERAASPNPSSAPPPIIVNPQSPGAGSQKNSDSAAASAPLPTSHRGNEGAPTSNVHTGDLPTNRNPENGADQPLPTSVGKGGSPEYGGLGSNGASSSQTSAQDTTSGAAPFVVAGFTVTPTQHTVLVAANQATVAPGAPAVTIGDTPVSVGSDGSFAVIKGTSQTFPTGLPRTLTVAGQTLTLQNGAPNFVIAGQTLTPGAPAAIINGQTVSIASDCRSAIVDGRTQQIAPSDFTSAPKPTNVGPALTVGDQALTMNTNGGFVLENGQTLTRGGVATLSGVQLSLALDGQSAVVGSSTRVLDGTATSSHGITASDITVTPNSAGMYVIDGQTLTPGGALTVGTHTISLATDGSSAVVDGATETFVGASARISSSIERTPSPEVGRASSAESGMVSTETSAVRTGDAHVARPSSLGLVIAMLVLLII